MRIWKLVITGGPCGGKNDGIDAIKNYFREKGFSVIVVPETATELINAGITIKKMGVEKFQSILLEKSLNKEIMLVAKHLKKLVFWIRKQEKLGQNILI